MTISGVHHTGLVVRDLDRSIESSHGVLGLPFDSEPSPWSDGDEPVHRNRLGAMHVAFRVDDVERTEADLEAAGVELLTDAHTVDDAVLAGWRRACFRDSGGISLEPVEVACTRPDERRAGIAAHLTDHPAAGGTAPSEGAP